MTVRWFPILFLASSLVIRADEPLAGRWSGKIQIPDRELTLIVDLARENQNWIGSAIIPGLNVKGAALSDIALQSSDVTFALTGTLPIPGSQPPRVKAHLVDGKLSGEFLEGGNSAQLVLEKIGPPQVEPIPATTPLTKQFEGEWKGEYQLLGYTRTVTIKLRDDPPKGASAEFVIVGKRVNNLPVSRVTQHGDFITIDSSGTGLTYEGRLRNDEIRGTLLQGSIESELTLRHSK